MSFPLELARIVSSTVAVAAVARTGRYRSWPSESVLLTEPLALGEGRASGLRRIHANAQRDAWDGAIVFREAVARHGGIQLDSARRAALAHPLAMLLWGELAAWIVSADLAARLDDPDARLAASSQVSDEARHFYVLRDYAALLQVPVPALDPYFRIAARRLLGAHSLELKLFTMQILVEGAAQTIFRFLADARVEPVLCDLLPYFERDEARHVGLGVLHLPVLLARRSPRRCRRLARKVDAIGNLFLATQLRYLPHYRTLGLDPRELIRRGDKMLHELSRRLGNLPGSGEPYLRSQDPSAPGYEARLDRLFPPAGATPGREARLLQRVVDFGAATLPS